MRKSTHPSKNRPHSPATDASLAAAPSSARKAPRKDSPADWNDETPARPSRKKTGSPDASSEPTPLLDRTREILLAETLRHAKQELLDTLLSSRTAVHWMAETEPRKSGLELDKAAQLALRRLIEKGDRDFAEIQANSSPEARETLAATVQEIRGVLAKRKFQVSRMDSLLETLNRSQARLRHLGGQFLSGAASALEEFRMVEKQLWMREAELDDFFARIKKWETLFLETRSALVVANLRLVTYCAKRFTKARMAPEDLAQEGYVALTLAVENYQAHVSKFSTFAMKVISSAMIRAIDDQSNLIRIPVHACEKLRKIQKQSEALRKDLGRDATDGEIARACNLSLEKVKELRAAAQTPVSLDTPPAVLGNTDPESLFAPQVPAYPKGSSSEDSAEGSSALIHQRLGRLSPREREVVERTYGLGNFEVCSEKEVARSLGCTETQIRVILSTALKIMAGPERISPCPALTPAPSLTPEAEMLGIAA